MKFITVVTDEMPMVINPLMIECFYPATARVKQETEEFGGIIKTSSYKEILGKLDYSAVMISLHGWDKPIRVNNCSMNYLIELIEEATI